MSTFPKSEFYDLGALLTGMGIGEAAVTLLSEAGVPTPVVDTRMSPPSSRLGPADDVAGSAERSALWAKYGQRVDNESAREMLAARMEQAAPAPEPVAAQASVPPAPRASEGQKAAAAASGGGVAAVTAFLKSKEGQQLQKQVMRGVFGLCSRSSLDCTSDGHRHVGASAGCIIVTPSPWRVRYAKLKPAAVRLDGCARRIVMSGLAPR